MIMLIQILHNKLGNTETEVEIFFVILYLAYFIIEIPNISILSHMNLYQNLQL
jgi:hypothetical protein